MNFKIKIFEYIEGQKHNLICVSQLDMKQTGGSPSIFLLSKAAADVNQLCHRRLCHTNFKNSNQLVFEDLDCGLHVLKFYNDSLCDYMFSNFNKPKSIQQQLIQRQYNHQSYSISIFVDLPLSKFLMVKSIFVIFDDFSRFTCVYCLREKSKTTQQMINFVNWRSIMKNSQ